MAVALLVGPVAAIAGSAPAYATDDGGFAAKMLELVNQQRAAANVAPLQWSASLGSIAQDGRYDGCGFAVQGRSADMGARNYFSHTIAGCGTQNVASMFGAAGVSTSGWGENIAWMSGTTDPLLAAQRLTNDLMASSGHRANILNPDFTHIGIGSWHTAAGQSWTGGGSPLTNVFVATQVFGRMASTTPTPTLPAAPASVTAAGADASINATWTPAASGAAVDSYGVFVWDASGYTSRYVTACATCRSATVTGLTNGATYYVSAHGHNGAGWGPATFSGWVTVAATPGAPTEVRALPANAAMTTSWRGPTNPGTAIDGYAVFAFDDNGYTNKYAWVCATCSTATVPGLVNGHRYFAVVYAHNPNGWGAATLSDWVVAGTPGPPGNVAVTRGNGSASVTWTAASSSGTAIDYYGIFAFDSTGYTGLWGVGCATCTGGSVPGLTNGHTYTLAVFAHNAQGWGTPTYSTQIVPAAS